MVAIAQQCGKSLRETVQSLTSHYDPTRVCACMRACVHACVGESEREYMYIYMYVYLYVFYATPKRFAYRTPNFEGFTYGPSCCNTLIFF